MNQFGIGQPVRRVEDRRFLTGRGSYVDDLTLPRQAYAFMLRSPHAHAHIRAIDTAAAAAAPGVLAVLTGDDVAQDGLGPIPCLSALTNRDGSAAPMPLRPAMVARPGTACRRHGGDGRRRKPRCRARRRRVDRGRLRHPAGRGRDRACARSGPAAGVGRGSRQSRLRLGCRRYGGGRAGLGGGAPSGGARYRQQPRRRQFDGAARCDRRLRSGRRRLYLVEFDPGLAFSAQPVGRKRLQDPGKPHPRRDARCRRRVRHEVFSVSRANPGAVGGEKAGPAGQMDRRSARTRS